MVPASAFLALLPMTLPSIGEIWEGVVEFAAVWVVSANYRRINVVDTVRVSVDPVPLSRVFLMLWGLTL